MSLMDEVNGDEIYNPFIRVYKPGSYKNYNCMNSTTFGEEGQSNLIFSTEIPHYEREKYYRVTAVVVEQSKMGHKRPQITGRLRSETLIGYITKSTLQEIFNKKGEN
jgi:hypothetical protein